ncbi:MAG TPA: phosphotransferase family protein, partial [Chitinophagales bacterium]|nr:phosphotransferase family protein [Chitinophagales bacterium]
VNGVILRNKPPEGISLAPELMRKLSEAAVDNLVALHAINIESSGLAQLGKPEGYVHRQVEGWIKRYYNAETDKIESMDEIAKWMQANMPKDIAPAFIHNDYKYDNLVLNPVNLSDIIAVLDWEMATAGDPLMDIATTLGYWAEPADHPFLREFSLTSLPGNLTREEVVRRYAEKSGRDVSNFLFYYVYACFKIGVIGQQIYARFVKGFTKDSRFGGLIHLVKACGANGSKAIQTGSISNFK